MAAVVDTFVNHAQGPFDRATLLLYVRNSRLEMKGSCALLMSQIHVFIHFFPIV